MNLGNDTDTIGAVGGAMAGIYYSQIPEDWITDLQGKDLLDTVVKKLVNNYQ